MRLGSRLTWILASLIGCCGLILASHAVHAQSGDVPGPDELDELLAPVALYPDALVAQICAASTDPQQILDVSSWVQQNPGMSPQARTDGAQAMGFDPAFIALINFPQVLDTMARNIDSYAAIGRAFSLNQAMVMDSIQRLRQQAYAAGNLQSNEYQSVEVQDQDGVQAVTIVPANPQVIYIPQYSPQVVYATPSPDTFVATSIISFGVGIALGAWITDNSRPWGWGGWGWNWWGRRAMIVHNDYWVVDNHYRPSRPYYRYRAPIYTRPIHVRPPPNWHDRPYYRPPAGGRPPGGGGRPPGGGAPPGSGTPGSGPGTRPPATGLPQARPGVGPRTPPATTRPSLTPAPRPTPRPAPQPLPTPRPSVTPVTPTPRPSVTPTPRPSVMRPSVTPTPRPPITPLPRPSQPSLSRPQPQTRPGAFAGYPGAGSPANYAGARPSAFSGSHNTSADRAAASRGRSSVQSQQRQPGGQRR